MDLFITNQPMDGTRYEKQLCYHENLVWVVPEIFPVNDTLSKQRLQTQELGERLFGIPNSRCVSATELAAVPFILLNNDNYLRACTDMIFQEHQVDPIVALEVENPSIAYNFSRLGVGATIMSNRLLEHLPRSKEVFYYKILSPYGRRSAYACYSRGHYVTAAMRQFLRFLENGTHELAGSAGDAAEAAGSCAYQVITEKEEEK